MYQIDDVPADNEELTKRMHNVLSQPEIDAIILNAKNDHMKWLKDHKQRGEQFRKIINRRDERELLQMVRCLYLHGKESGLTSTDSQYMRRAEEIIEEQFSFTLKTKAKNVSSYIRDILGED